MASTPKATVPFTLAKSGIRKRTGMAHIGTHATVRVHVVPNAPPADKPEMISDVSPNPVIEHSGTEFLDATSFVNEPHRGRIHGQRSDVPPRGDLHPLHFFQGQGFFWEPTPGDYRPIPLRPKTPIKVAFVGSSFWVPYIR